MTLRLRRATKLRAMSRGLIRSPELSAEHGIMIAHCHACDLTYDLHDAEDGA